MQEGRNPKQNDKKQNMEIPVDEKKKNKIKYNELEGAKKIRGLALNVLIPGTIGTFSYTQTYT